VPSIFYRYFPSNRRHLLGSISGNSIIGTFTEKGFRDMIIDCLTGINPRIYTEIFGVRVVHGVTSGITEMFAKGKEQDTNFICNAPVVAAELLCKHHKNTLRLSQDDRNLCEWICNLTGKGFTNILEKDPNSLVPWIKEVLKQLTDIGTSYEENIVNMAKHNASLAKKGGLKSAMGNLFESLMLYSALTACNLPFILKSELEDNAKYPCFTLDATEATTKGRQTDALILTGLKSPTHICIDIGFIAEGNPEIIADKTQRFSNALGGGLDSLVATIIIVSSIPEKKGRLVEEQARITGATVIAMSGKNWIYELQLSLSKLGIDGIIRLEKDPTKTKLSLDNILPTSKELLKLIPRNLSEPSDW
jgi:hypothetical protein